MTSQKQDRLSGHAVVAGGSLAGLLTARVLADHFAEVTVIERDVLPSLGAYRRGVPQDQHTHCLIASGREAVETLVPGFTAAVVADGGTLADMQGECRWYVDGHRMRQAPIGLHILLAGRPLLEGHVRERVRAIGNVRLHDGEEVIGLIPTESGDDRALIITLTTENRRGGAMIAQEDDTWIISLFGYLDEQAPQDLEGFIEFAGTLDAKDIYHVIRNAEPVGDGLVIRFPASRRHRYERLGGFPEGYLVLGDALCSFNPIYGQGMSTAALQARLLEECLRDQGTAPRAPATAFFARVRPVLDAAWDIAVGGDLKYPEVEGVRGPESAQAQAYLSQVHLAASRDAEVGRRFVRVVNLTDGPESLQDPAFVDRVLHAAAS
ncbi:hypothetical protein [Nonomuraea sp. NPDC050643]|uniref:FAD-dependent oxidoreductase n=1 Tax=Nonomuraea sp. NPDC050643 TaxID=3155660 RepID=UPI0033EF56EE